MVVGTKDYKIPLDKKIVLDLDFGQVALILHALHTASETFKTGSIFMFGKDKKDCLHGIKYFDDLYNYIDSVLIKVEADVGDDIA